MRLCKPLRSPVRRNGSTTLTHGSGKLFGQTLRLMPRAWPRIPDPVVAKLGLRLSNGTSGAIPGTGAAAFIAIAEAADDVQALIARLKADTDTMVRTAIARELARDTTLLNKLADFLTTLGDGIDEADDQESEEEEELRQPRIGREAAYESYTRTIRAQARSATAGRSLNRQSRSSKIGDWLGDRRLPTNDLRTLGVSLQIQSAARRFVNPFRRYFDRLALRYRQFRREQQSEGRWYAKDGFTATDLTPLEVDFILLALLRGMRGLLADRQLHVSSRKAATQRSIPLVSFIARKLLWTKPPISRRSSSPAWRPSAILRRSLFWYAVTSISALLNGAAAPSAIYIG